MRSPLESPLAPPLTSRILDTSGTPPTLRPTNEYSISRVLVVDVALTAGPARRCVASCVDSARRARRGREKMSPRLKKLNDPVLSEDFRPKEQLGTPASAPRLRTVLSFYLTPNPSSPAPTPTPPTTFEPTLNSFISLVFTPLQTPACALGEKKNLINKNRTLCSPSFSTQVS